MGIRAKKSVSTGQAGLFGPVEQCATGAEQTPATGSPAPLARVAFETAGDNLFDYLVPGELAQALGAGQRVRAPLGKGNHPRVGFCVELPDHTDAQRLKAISEVLDPTPLIDADLMRLAQWICQYYCCPLGQVLAAMVPAAVKRQTGMVKRRYVRLTDQAPTDPAALANLRISPKGRAIIAFLAQNTDSPPELPLDDVAQAVACGKAPFQTLARAGLLAIIERRELHLPPLPCPTQEQPSAVTPNPDQQQALTVIQQLLAQDTFNAVLLHGVTGSGKTEVYMRCIETILQAGRQALVLVPEIAMTAQTLSRFQQRFGRVALLHSGLNASQRHQQWRWIADGGAQVVVGARSAVFAPLPNLGLIVVDEEHEPSYKQDTAPRYHGRDVAVKLAQLKGITVILGSATPSLESLLNCQSKSHYHLVELPRRVLDLPLPAVAIIDMRTEAAETKTRPLLSRMLVGALTRCLEQKRQAILLLNRRGHSSYAFCPSCQFSLQCPNCDVTLTYHRTRNDSASQRRDWVMCHHCLHSSQLPTGCPICRGRLLLIGPGTQNAEDEIARLLPAARLCRVDSDSIRQNKYHQILTDFGAGRIDILLGTQMIGKGLDYPNVALVGVLNADTSLALPDFRSSERTFQLVAQVAGRCGRAGADGQVIVQSFLPEEPAIQLACRHDYLTFAQQELTLRRHCHMPPYHRLARIVLRHTKLAPLTEVGKQLRQKIDRLLTELGLSVEVRGPVPAGIAYLENYHRQEIILRAEKPHLIQKLLDRLRRKELTALPTRTTVDVDPINLI